MPRNGDKSIVTAEFLKAFYERLGSSKTHDAATTIPETGDNNSLPTNDAVRNYVGSKIAAADAMRFKGTVNQNADLPNATAKVGDTYKVATAGEYSGQKCEVGDIIICTTSGSSKTSATWTIVQNNIDGAVTGPTGSTNNSIAVFDGTTGKIIKDSGFTIAKSVPANAQFTDTTYQAGAGINITGTTNTIVNTGVRSITQDSSDGHKLTVNTNGTSTTITIPDNDTTYSAGTGLSLNGTTFNHTNSVTAGTVSEGGNARTLAFGGKFKVPSVSYDAQGHITATTTTELTMPAQPAESSITITSGGTGNAVTSITASGHQITMTRGASFVLDADKAKHAHGNITSGGTITSTGVAIENGDTLLIADSSSTGKIEKTSITFDGSSSGKYLSAKGTWEEIPSIPSITATTTGSGNAVTSISSDGHTVTATKGATFAENAFKTIAVKASSSASATNVVADSAADTLTLVAGSNVTLSADATNDTITISATDTDTHYEGKNVVATSSTGKANGSVTGTEGVYLNFVENDTVRSTHKIIGAGGAKVTSDASGNITISASTGTNTYVTGATVAATNEVTLTRNDGNTVKFTPIFSSYSTTSTTEANDLNWVMGTYTGS